VALVLGSRALNLFDHALVDIHIARRGDLPTVVGEELGAVEELIINASPDGLNLLASVGHALSVIARGTIAASVVDLLAILSGRGDNALPILASRVARAGLRDGDAMAGCRVAIAPLDVRGVENSAVKGLGAVNAVLHAIASLGVAIRVVAKAPGLVHNAAQGLSARLVVAIASKGVAGALETEIGGVARGDIVVPVAIDALAGLAQVVSFRIWDRRGLTSNTLNARGGEAVVGLIAAVLSELLDLRDPASDDAFLPSTLASRVESRRGHTALPDLALAVVAIIGSLAWLVIGDKMRLG
jgi:hypothetical protein